MNNRKKGWGGLAVTVNINELQLRDAIIGADHESALETVMVIDLAIADLAFTETLVKRLMASLLSDLDGEEYAALVSELSEITKP